MMVLYRKTVIVHYCFLAGFLYSHLIKAPKEVVLITFVHLMCVYNQPIKHNAVSTSHSWSQTFYYLGCVLSFCFVWLL